MNRGVSILSNVNLLGGFNFGPSLAEFPQDPSPGVFVVKDHILFVYLTIGTYHTWWPLSEAKRYFIHNQLLPSQRWTVTHNLDCESAWIQPQDLNGNLLPYTVVEDTVNKFVIDLPQAVAGTAIVVAPTDIDVPNVVATSGSFGRGKVTLGQSGVLVDGTALPTVTDVQQLDAALNTAITAAYESADAALSQSLQTALAALQTALQQQLATEVSSRQSGDTSLSSQLATEASTRQSSDNSLNAAISALQTSVNQALATVNSNLSTLSSTVNSNKTAQDTKNTALDTKDADLQQQITSHQHTFASLTSKPTSRDGFGLADVYTKTEVEAFIQNYRGSAIGAHVSSGITAASGTTTIPLDSTTPAITKGTQIWSETITPLDPASNISIQVGFVAGASSAREMVVALFRGNVCIASSVVYLTSSKASPVTLVVEDPSLNTNARTYSMRVGLNSRATWYVNRKASGATLGGTLSASGYIITEFF